MKPWKLDIRAAAADASTIEIVVYDVIGADIFGEGVTARAVLQKLRSSPDAKRIDLRLNSIGGVLDDAKSIGNLLAERAADGVEIVAHVDGIAASATAYLTTFATRVVMPDNAFLMIHRSRAGMRGTRDDFEAAAKALGDSDEIMVEAFAAASARRGKGKSKEDFAQAIAKGDRYFRASEAIEWGLADETAKALKVAACALDLEELGSVPDDLRALASAAAGATAASAQAALPFIDTATLGVTDSTAPLAIKTTAASAPPKAERTSVATNTEPVVTGKETNMSDIDPKTNPYASIVASLGLISGASETDILARLGRLRDLEVQASAILGVTDSAQLIGAIRGIKAKADTADAAQAELAQVKSERDRQTFDSLIAKGQADRKLTPAEAKFEQEKFEAAVAEGRGAHAVAALQGYLNVAPRKYAEPKTQPAQAVSAKTSDLTWNGKTYGDLAPMEKHRLKAEDAELYAQMRAEHQRQVA